MSRTAVDKQDNSLNLSNTSMKQLIYCITHYELFLSEVPDVPAARGSRPFSRSETTLTNQATNYWLFSNNEECWDIFIAPKKTTEILMFISKMSVYLATRVCVVSVQVTKLVKIKLSTIKRVIYGEVVLC